MFGFTVEITNILKAIMVSSFIFFVVCFVLLIFGWNWIIILSFIPIFSLYASFCIKTTDEIRAMVMAIFTFLQLLIFIYLGTVKANVIFDIAHVFLFEDIYYALRIDGIALLFAILTNFVFLVAYLSSRAYIKVNYAEFLIQLATIHWLLLQCFFAFNLLFFYIFFEAILIPMFLLIGIWGSRRRKIFASYLFFMYTLSGSLIMLLAICYIATLVPSLLWEDLIHLHPHLTFFVESILFFCFFLAFAVKTPMFPFHLWLPEAHVEAPTLGSVILAGILLKLGGYGMLRFLIPIFPNASANYSYLVYAICLISVLYSALIGLCQLDMKKIIAYSSITHMNFSVAGLFSNDLLGIQGAIYSMFSHGLISSGLFMCVGVLYDRYKTRLIGYYSGLGVGMPLFTVLFFLLIIANVGIPPFSGFISEIVVLFGLVHVNRIFVMLLFLSSIFMTINFFWFFNRVCCGPLTKSVFGLKDLSADEFVSLFFLVFSSFIFGLFPSFIFSFSLVFVEHAVLY